MMFSVIVTELWNMGSGEKVDVNSDGSRNFAKTLPLMGA
jgi:hypothetical protein